MKYFIVEDADGREVEVVSAALFMELVDALKQIHAASGCTVCNIDWVRHRAQEALSIAEDGDQ